MGTCLAAWHAAGHRKQRRGQGGASGRGRYLGSFALLVLNLTPQLLLLLLLLLHPGGELLLALAHGGHVGLQPLHLRQRPLHLLARLLLLLLQFCCAAKMTRMAQQPRLVSARAASHVA